MKKVILAAMLFLACGVGYLYADDSAATTTASTTGVIIEPVGLDLSSVFSKTRGGTMFIFVPKGMTLATLYAPVISFHSSDGTELINANAGAALNIDDASKGSPYFALGFRLDNLLVKSVSGAWAKEHLTTAALPSMEASIAGTWYSPEHIWCAGATLAVKFGK